VHCLSCLRWKDYSVRYQLVLYELLEYRWYVGRRTHCIFLTILSHTNQIDNGIVHDISLSHVDRAPAHDLRRLLVDCRDPDLVQCLHWKDCSVYIAKTAVSTLERLQCLHWKDCSVYIAKTAVSTLERLQCPRWRDCLADLVESTLEGL